MTIGNRWRDVPTSPRRQQLAWCLVSVPGRGDANEAIGWARKAVELVQPNNADYRNTLGAALYRAGRFAEAAGELERNIAQNTQTCGYDWVFLAMCRQRLGQAEPARYALERARKWRAPATRTTPGLNLRISLSTQGGHGCR